MFEWDAVKAVSNELKHGVGFQEAATAFTDPLGLDGADITHSRREPGFFRIG